MTEAFEEESEPSNDEVTPLDVVDVLQGKATPEQERRLLAALDDPQSEVHQWLKDAQNWAVQSLPSTSANRAKDIAERSTDKTDVTLDAVLDYLLTKRADGALVDEEISAVVTAGGLKALASPERRTPIESITVAGRMLKKLCELRPDLADEVHKLRSSRQLER